MKRKFLLLLSAVVLLMAALIPQAAKACTVFASAQGEETMAGNNEDWFDKDTFLWFVPAQKGTFGYVAYGFENAHPQGGMNDQGLFFDWFAQGGKTCAERSDKLNYAGDLSVCLLTSCSSVRDVLSLYERYNDVNLGYATLLVADKTGDMATVTWDWQSNKLRVERNKGGTMAIGVGAAKIDSMLSSKSWAEEEGFSIMAQTASNENTLYSTVCSLKSGRITLYNLRDYTKKADWVLADELKKGERLYRISSLLPVKTRSLRNELTPASMRSTAQNIACAAAMCLLAAFFLWCLLDMLLRKKSGRRLSALPVAGLAANLAMLCLAFVVNFYAYFIAAYGIEMLGRAAVALSWAAAALALAQAVFVVIDWIQKTERVPLRAALTVSCALQFSILWYLTTLHMYLG